MHTATHQVANLVLWFVLSAELNANEPEMDEYGKRLNIEGEYYEQALPTLTGTYRPIH